MKSVLQSYVDGINAGDVDAVLALFADDAVIEDPFGSEPKTGETLAEFYRGAAGGGVKLTLQGPIRGSHGDSAAMAFTVEVQGMTIDAIDVMTFNADGKIIKMDAYWGPDDVRS